MGTWDAVHVTLLYFTTDQRLNIRCREELSKNSEPESIGASYSGETATEKKRAKKDFFGSILLV